MEIEVENVDKTGSFIGSLFINGQNLAVCLLEHGYATIHEYSASESQYSSQLFAAERSARDAKKGLWKESAAVVEQETAGAVEEEKVAAGPRREYIDVVVSEYLSGSRFYVQVVNEDVRKLERLMAELSHYQNSRSGAGPHRPRVGDLVSAKFTEDDSWYRAKVRRVSSEGVEVLYIDYGNVSDRNREQSCQRRVQDF